MNVGREKIVFVIAHCVSIVARFVPSVEKKNGANKLPSNDESLSQIELC